MKRSEMIELIKQHFEFFHNNKFDAVFKTYEDYAEALSINIEDVGMWRVFYVCWLKPKITRAKKMLGITTNTEETE